jgi:hypothetical protein
MCKTEVWIAGCDLAPTPLDRLRPDVEAFVRTILGQVGSERDRRSPNTAADVQHVFVWPECRRLLKLSEVPAADLYPSADDVDQFLGRSGYFRSRMLHSPSRHLTSDGDRPGDSMVCLSAVTHDGRPGCGRTDRQRPTPRFAARLRAQRRTDCAGCPLLRARAPTELRVNEDFFAGMGT